MAKILIFGTPNDAHAIAVELGLRQLGAEVYSWITGDMPDFAAASIRVDPDAAEARISVTHDGRTVCLNDFDVIWNRRSERPRAPDYASAFDVPVIEEETFLHCENMLHLLTSMRRTVNCPLRQRRADRKAVQLQAAGAIGFAVLPTLFSNDYDAVAQFCAEHKTVVAKPHRQHSWTTENSWLNALTFDMPDPASIERRAIEACPMIFQKKVVRDMEVRLIAFGGQVFAARVAGAKGMLDARLESLTNGFEEIERVEVPQAIAEKCARYLEALQIDYGAFDFIVDEAGTWVFLECNESGQCLYLEQFLPDLHILDAFCRWFIALAGGMPTSDATLSFLDIMEPRNASYLYEEKRSHKRVTTNPVINEAVAQ